MNLISEDYLAQMQQMHNAPEGFGGSGHKHAPEVLRLIAFRGIHTVLDYGCGEGTLKAKLAESVTSPVLEYDPAVEGKNKPPVPAHLVVCTDVLEHIEPQCLKEVLQHIYSLTEKMAFLVIATRPANKLLPDGRNAHLIIEKAHWWQKRINKMGWSKVEYEIVTDLITKKRRALKVWAYK